MKRRTYSIFFGTCFMAAMLVEVYCLVRLNSNLYTMLGVGLLVLVTGYQFMDSVISSILQNSRIIKNNIDGIVSEELNKWNDRYIEILNIQKAMYAATKKNTARFNELAGELISRIETLENSNTKEWKKTIELQKRSMEGHKKAVNLEVHYNKENTKELINAIHKEGSESNREDQLKRIIELLEANKELLNEYANAPVRGEFHERILSEPEAYESIDQFDALPEDDRETQPYNNVKPIYDDPNKNLTTDEIAALFASAGK